MTIKFGPAGLGPVATAKKTLKEYNEKGLNSCEIAFTYKAYIKKQDAIKIKKIAEKYKINLSIHGSYFINLNSIEKEKIEASKKRILEACEIGELLGAKRVVFHPGYYGKSGKDITYTNIKLRIIELMDYLKKKDWKIKLAPETMGKINVFGSPEEISNLAKETGCSFCIDFAHILAREKKVDYKKIKKLFPQKQWHCHFSGIEYNEKGERRHLNIKPDEWKNLLENLPKNKDINIICESPSPIKNSIEGMEIYKKQYKKI